jgi:hypothetical protein
MKLHSSESRKSSSRGAEEVKLKEEKTYALCTYQVLRGLERVCESSSTRNPESGGCTDE